MSVVQKIDSSISYIPRERKEDGKERPRRRIIYFCSEDRHIIKKAINESSYLWELLMPENQSVRRELRYEYLEGYHMLVDFCQNTDVQDEKVRKSSVKVRAYTLTDFHAYKDIKDPRKNQLGMVKRFLDQAKYQDALLLISSPYIQIPEGFDDEIELIHLGTIDVEDIKEIIQKQLEIKREQEDPELERVAKKFLGLTERQILSILARTKNVGYCCELDAETEQEKADCQEYMEYYITQEKKHAMEKDPVIEFIEYKEEEEAVGLSGYNEWLEIRKKIFTNPIEAQKRGVKVPNGVLLTGIPGTGKTMLAKKTI